MKSILKWISKAEIETAAGTRKCSRSESHVIEKGEQHLAVYGEGVARKNFCLPCAGKLVDEAIRTLQALKVEVADAQAEEDAK